MRRYRSSPAFHTNCDTYFAILAKRDGLQSTIEKLMTWVKMRDEENHVRTESNVNLDMSVGSLSFDKVSAMENLTDVAGNMVDEKSAGHVDIPETGQRHLLDLDEFLARPLKITTLTVAPSTDLTYSVDVWDVFLSHPSIRAKLRNYAYISGTLHVRVTVSGSPFHYGKFQVSYQPFANINENMIFYDANIATTRFQALSYLSQSPGSAVIDVKANMPVEIELPFICPQPMLRLFNKSALILPELSSYADAVDMGRLYINSINQVQSASATPTSVSVFLYAWMTDLDLGAPTGTVITVGTESNIQDEREKGPVEKFATRAEEYCEYLTLIPEIGELAAPAGMIAGGLAKLAAWFGWSYPTMINEPMRVKNDPYQNGAQTIGYDLGKKITLDPKQELTVDPRLGGITKDEMSISYLCSVESLLDTFNWQVADTALGSSIWMAPVNPFICKRLALGAPTPYLMQPTALGFAATPFEYWRGDITFRFEVVASAFHRGKLAFYYEPNISQNVVIDSTLDTNKQFVKVLDIQESQDISFTVKWAFPKAWARVLDTSLMGDLGTVGFLGDTLFEYANGYIAVVPFTTLQSPDGSDIEINVYIHSDSMVFNQLVSTRIPSLRPSTESHTQTPINHTAVDLNDSTANMDNIGCLHFGEIPVSFRALVRRFNGVYDPLDLPVTGAVTQAFKYNNVIIPEPSPKFDGVARKGESLIAYLRYAYLGMKGGIRQRLSFISDYEGGDLGRAKVSLLPPATTSVLYKQFVAVDDSLSSRMVGTVDFVPATNGGIEFEAPCYTNNLFLFSFADDPAPSAVTTINPSYTRRFTTTFPVKASTSTIYVVHDAAAGEDFTMFRFQGASPYQYS